MQNQIVKLIKNRKNVFAVKEKIYCKDEKNIADFFCEEFSKNFFIIWNKKRSAFIENLGFINSSVKASDPKNTTAIEVESKLEILKTESELIQILKLLGEIKALAFTEKITIRKRGYLKNEAASGIENEIGEAEDLMKNLYINKQNL